jgi:hypothetical protein
MAESFPPPRSTAPIMPKEQLLQQFAILGDILTAGTLLIDVRRTDYEGGTIRGSLNIPAQGFCLSMPALHRLCVGDGLAVISRVVFYCGRYILVPCLYPMVLTRFLRIGDCTPRKLVHALTKNVDDPKIQ